MEAQETRPRTARKNQKSRGKDRNRTETRPRSTRIVCTIGPACKSPEMIERLIRNGMNVARLNFSHGTHESHLENIETIRHVSSDIQRPVAILQDLQGHKIRVGSPRGDDPVILVDD